MSSLQKKRTFRGPDALEVLEKPWETMKIQKKPWFFGFFQSAGVGFPDVPRAVAEDAVGPPGKSDVEGNTDSRGV